jgi:hypothetical protein
MSVSADGFGVADGAGVCVSVEVGAGTIGAQAVTPNPRVSAILAVIRDFAMFVVITPGYTPRGM